MLPLNPVIVPIVEEGLKFNILPLPNMECLPLFVVRIAISMTDVLRVCDLLAQRLRGAFLREGVNAHFFGNRSHFKHIADLFEEDAQFVFCGVSWQLIFMACADKQDRFDSGLSSGLRSPWASRAPHAAFPPVRTFGRSMESSEFIFARASSIIHMREL